MVVVGVSCCEVERWCPARPRALTLALSRRAGEGIVVVVGGASAKYPNPTDRRRKPFIAATACPTIAAIILTRNDRPLSRWAGEG